GCPSRGRRLRGFKGKCTSSPGAAEHRPPPFVSVFGFPRLFGFRVTDFGFPPGGRSLRFAPVLLTLTAMGTNRSATGTGDPPRPGLVRALGPLMAMAVVIGTVIGSGVFKKPQAVAENLPTFGMAAAVWVAGGLLALLGSLTLAEVAVLFPRA